MEVGHKDDRSLQQDRDKDPHRLSEHVAERHHIEESDGLDRTRPMPIAVNLACDGRQIRTDVAVSVNHTLGFCGRSRGVNDLNDVLAVDRGALPVGRYRQIFEVLNRKDLHPWVRDRCRTSTDKQVRSGFGLNSRNPGRCRTHIHRNDHNSLAEASPEDGNPFRTVFTPEKQAVTGAQAPDRKVSRKSGDGTVELLIGPDFSADSVRKADGFAWPQRPDARKQFQQRFHS